MKNKIKGIIYIILAAFFYSITNFLVKSAGDIPSFQKSFFRNLVVLIFIVGLIIKQKNEFLPKKENYKTMFFRCLAGTIGLVSNYYAVDNLILSDATVIIKLSPFFTIIFAYFVLNEKIKLYQGISIIIGFLGTIFVIKPSLDINMFPFLVGILGAGATGFAYTLVRKLSEEGEKSTTIVFGFILLSVIFTLPFTIINYKYMNLKSILFLIVSGFFAFLAQLFTTNAYKYAPAREIGVFDFSQLLFAALIGFMVFAEVPDKYSLIGYFIIISASIYMFIKNYKEGTTNEI